MPMVGDTSHRRLLVQNTLIDYFKFLFIKHLLKTAQYMNLRGRTPRSILKLFSLMLNS